MSRMLVLKDLDLRCIDEVELECDDESDNDRLRFLRRESRRKEARKLEDERRLRCLRSRWSSTVMMAVSNTFLTFF